MYNELKLFNAWKENSFFYFMQVNEKKKKKSNYMYEADQGSYSV